MRRKLLFILMVAMVFVVSCKEKSKRVNDLAGKGKVLLDKEVAPEITKKMPVKGNVIGIENQIITFYIDFKANPRDSISVYKDDKKITKEVATTDSSVTVTLDKAKKEDEGKYKIVIKNKLGTAEAEFDVTVVDK